MTRRLELALCVLAVYNNGQAQRISNREFKLWTFLQGTFLAETCLMCGGLERVLLKGNTAKYLRAAI